MYQALNRIFDEKYRGRWFVDSGSLLGLIRDKKFLSSDRGIDISLLVEDYQEPDIFWVVSEIEKMGFVKSVYRWNGIAYKYCFIPCKNTGYPYSVDLHLFKKDGETYYCPQISLRNRKGLKGRFRSIRKGNEINRESGLGSRVKAFVAETYRFTFKYFGKAMEMDKYVRNQEGDAYLWVMPQALLHGTAPSEVNGLQVLVDPDDYLAFRYGDWKTPNPNWVTLRDDGGIKKTTPEELDVFVAK